MSAPTDLQALALSALRGEISSDDGGPREQIRLRRNLQKIAAVVRLYVQGRQTTNAASTPEHWGHLRIERRIGEGAFGEVFRAHDTVLHRDVSLKLQRLDSAEQDGAAYIEEARRLARVRHPNVLAIHGADVHAGRVGMWADLLRGETLAARLGDERRLEPEAVLDLAGQLAAGLTAVHGARLCHGDVKPANVMCETDGRYVLMDFGAAREHAQGEAFHYGTPRFMSPERLRRDQPPSVEDDLFAVGVILYRAALGRYPLRVRSDADDPLPNGCGIEVEHAALRRAVGTPLARLIGDLLDAEPSRRPRAAALRERYHLLRALPARRRRRALVGVVIASLLGGLIAALLGMLTAREATLREVEQRERAEQVSHFLRRWLEAPQAEAYGRQVKVLDVIGDAERELVARPPQQRALRAELRLLLARTLSGLGEHARAQTLAQQVLDDFAKDSESAAFPRLRAHSLLAAIDEDRGEVEAAALRRSELLEQLAASPYAGGELHLRTLLEQADQRVSAGDTDGAAANIERVSAAIDALADTELQRDLSELLNLTRLSLLGARGQFREAATLAEQALAAIIERYGERHSSVFTARNRWVEALAQSGQLAAAEAPARANLEAARSWLGDEDRYTLAALVALGNVLDDTGRHREALAFRREALERADRLAGASPTDRAQARINLANSLKESDARGEAIALYREVVDQRDQDGINPIVVLMAQSNLSEALVEDGRYAAAAENARDSLQRMRSALGDGHPFVGHAQGMLGAALTGLGRAAEGRGELDAALTVVRDSIGEDNPLAADLSWYRAEALAAEGDVDAAVTALDALLVKLRALYPANHPDIARSEQRRAELSPL